MHTRRRLEQLISIWIPGYSAQSVVKESNAVLGFSFVIPVFYQ